MKFSPSKIRFGPKPNAGEGDDEPDGLPTPKKLEAMRLKMLSVERAKEVVSALPGLGESYSLHCVFQRRIDLCDVLDGILTRFGRCEQMVLATLTWNEENLHMMLRWIDENRVKKLVFMGSTWVRSGNPALLERTVDEFKKRNQPFACLPNHAKVYCLQFESGERFVAESSCNLVSSGSYIEQLTIDPRAELHDWHASWIKNLVMKHEGETP